MLQSVLFWNYRLTGISSAVVVAQDVATLHLTMLSLAFQFCFFFYHCLCNQTYICRVWITLNCILLFGFHSLKRLKLLFFAALVWQFVVFITCISKNIWIFCFGAVVVTTTAIGCWVKPVLGSVFRKVAVTLDTQWLLYTFSPLAAAKSQAFAVWLTCKLHEKNCLCEMTFCHSENSRFHFPTVNSGKSRLDRVFYYET